MFCARCFNRGMAAKRFRAIRCEISREFCDLGCFLSGIELDQHIALVHMLTVLDIGGEHLTGIERLDDFHTAGRLEFALHGRNDVDRPK